MTAERAHSYSLLMRMIESAPGELNEKEIAQLRRAADALLFCGDSVPDLESREELNEVRALAHRLAQARRWTQRFAAQVLSSVEACGPQASAVSTTGLGPTRRVFHRSGVLR
jgi:hypothetical protein